MSKYLLDKDFKMYANFRPPLNKGVIFLAEKILAPLYFLEKSGGGVTVRRALIKGCKGTKVRLLVYEPLSCGNKTPCLLYCHGGGFVYRASPYHYRLAREYALKTPCKVIFADYSLAPENPFPIPAEECFGAYLWAVKHADLLGINKNKIAVYGDSAGGCLAAAIALMARDRKVLPPCLQMLIYPALDRRMNTASMEKFDDTPIWNGVSNRKIWKYYLPDANVKHIEYASPAEASSLENLPDAYIETAEFDCLRDEGITYARRLISDGNSVRFAQIKGAMHGFDMAVNSGTVRNCIENRVNALRGAFKEKG